MGHQADVRQFGTPIHENDVGGLDVPVRQVLAVQVQQRVGKLAAHLQAVIQGKGLVAGKLLVRLERTGNILVRVDMDSRAGVVAQLHHVIIKGGAFVVAAHMQDVHQARMVAGDGLVLKNAFKLPVEGPFVLKILPPDDFDGPPCACQGFCQPDLSIRSAADLANHFMVRDGRGGTHHPFHGQCRQVAAGHG